MSEHLGRGFRIMLWLIPFYLLYYLIFFSGLFVTIGSDNLGSTIIWMFAMAVAGFFIVMYGMGWAAKRTE